MKTRVKRADTKYNGVTHDPTRAKKYRAWIKTGSKMVRLGDYATLLEAVLAADLARYLVWGENPIKWYNEGRHLTQKPPNTVPQVDLPFNPQAILSDLLRHKVVDAVTLANNWTAYKDMAAKIAEANPA